METEKTKNCSPKRTSNIPVEQELIENNRNLFVDFNIPWSFNATYKFGTVKRFTAGEGYKTEETQDIRSRGDFKLMDKVKIAYNASYDVVEGRTNSLSLDLHLDLHCWEFVVSYIPIGVRQSYNIRLNVKSSILQDLKLQKRGDIQENGLLW